MRIIVSEVAKYDIRSCNRCYARNYHTEFSNIGECTEKLYSLDIGHVSICLCYDCLREVSATIEGFISMIRPTEKGGGEK